ncbi:MAG: hypothetical protein CMJ83_20575 [Planctomycetes bacterium]|nr:hypothetical protein [Planctomycetota bacterium]
MTRGIDVQGELDVQGEVDPQEESRVDPMKSLMILTLVILAPFAIGQEKPATPPSEGKPVPVETVAAEVRTESDPLALPFPTVVGMAELVKWGQEFLRDGTERLRVARAAEDKDAVAQVLVRLGKARLHAAREVERLIPKVKQMKKK